MKESIKFIFDERAAIDASAFLLKLHANRMNYMKLIKLLYLSDRQSLIRYGETITTDSFVSLKLGPVTSNIYDLIKGSYQGEKSTWGTYFLKKRYDLVLINMPENECLSQRNMDILTEIDTHFKDYDCFKLSSWCHANIKEWKDPGDSSMPISVEDILRVAYSGKEAELNKAVDGLLVASQAQIESYRTLNRA